MNRNRKLSEKTYGPRQTQPHPKEKRKKTHTTRSSRGGWYY